MPNFRKSGCFQRFSTNSGSWDYKNEMHDNVLSGRKYQLTAAFVQSNRECLYIGVSAS